MNSSNDDDDIIEVQSEPEIPVVDVKVEPDPSWPEAFTQEIQYQYEFLEDSEEFQYEYLEDLEPDKSTGNIQSDDESDDGDTKDLQNKNNRSQNDSDPEYMPDTDLSTEPSENDNPTESDDSVKLKSRINPSENDGSVNLKSRMKLKNYRRTIRQSGCIFKDCNLKETELISNFLRIKLLQEHKLYIVRPSEVCSIHMRDQNWEDLIQCSDNNFKASEIEDILLLLKEASQATFNFETIELIPTRLIRYWMNVNKVQFHRILNGFSLLKTLDSPKTALSVYLMYLQNNDFERIALLMQVSETKIKGWVTSVQAIVPCKNYDELNEMFKLEY